MVNVEAVIWWLFLLDSLGANIAVWCCQSFFKKRMGNWFWKHLPLTKGWALVYLVIVLWIGYALFRLGILPY